MKSFKNGTFSFTVFIALFTILVLSACSGGAKQQAEAIKFLDVNLTSKVNVRPETLIESPVVRVTGINEPGHVSISSGSMYRIDGGTYTDYPGTIYNGSTIQVRHISSQDFNSSSYTTLSINGKIARFKSTTQADTESLIMTNFINVKDFGAVGDGVTDDQPTIKEAVKFALDNNKSAIYFPNGTYFCQDGFNNQGIKFIGESKENSIIKASELLGTLISSAENITIQNFKFHDYFIKNLTYKNCKFLITSPASGSTYLYLIGYVTHNTNVRFINCDFKFPQIYVALSIQDYDSVFIKNCTFDGNATHSIRLSNPAIRNPQVSIIGNTVTGGKTGIFVGGNRDIPMEGGLIEGNTVSNQYEEGISLDGFGNNRYRVPVITNGPIADAWNDENGSLVVSLNDMYEINSTNTTSDTQQPTLVSSRTDWTNFYFSFGEGTGLEGNITKIIGFDAINNTLTLGIKKSASNIGTGSNTNAGVQAGFYNWIIKDNNLSGILGNNNAYGTALSVYLNVFGILVENNSVINSAHALNLAGGVMLSTYKTLAYNNIVRNNRFIDCDQYSTGDPSEGIGVIRMNSTYGGSYQYNNKLLYNLVNNGPIFIEKQKNLMMLDNNFTNANVLIKDSFLVQE